MAGGFFEGLRCESPQHPNQVHPCMCMDRHTHVDATSAPPPTTLHLTPLHSLSPPPHTHTPSQTLMLNLREGKGALTPGGKDIGKNDRDVDCELEYSDAKLAGRCGTRTVHCLQRQDSVTADVEAYEAHAASRGASRSLLEEQSEADLEVPVSTAAEEHRRGCGCRLCSQRHHVEVHVWELRSTTGDRHSSLDPARRACEHCPCVSLSFTLSRRDLRTACTVRPS